MRIIIKPLIYISRNLCKIQKTVYLINWKKSLTVFSLSTCYTAEICYISADTRRWTNVFVNGVPTSKTVGQHWFNLLCLLGCSWFGLSVARNLEVPDSRHRQTGCLSLWMYILKSSKTFKDLDCPVLSMVYCALDLYRASDVICSVKSRA